MPLVQTLLDVATDNWHTLMRRTAADDVQGQLKLRVTWDITAAGLLQLKVRAFENVLAQRLEILMAMDPVPAAVAATWGTLQDESVQPPAGLAGSKLPGQWQINPVRRPSLDCVYAYIKYNTNGCSAAVCVCT